LFAQFEYDIIDRNEINIIKKGSTQTYSSTSKVADLKNKEIVERQFGKNHKEEKHFAETKNVNYDNMVYDNGLVFGIPEDERLPPEFHIKSNKYLLQLSNEQIIQVGMKAQELKTIFPKSFEKRTVYNKLKGKKGKVRVAIYFSSEIDGKKQIEDSLIIFILNNENGIVEEFYTWEPS
jgi:hypothetical protein